jgi:two-component system NtrC family response regulator
MDNFQSLQPGRVLLVDDEPAFRLLAARFLQQQGFDVVSVADLEAARGALAQQTFDLMLLDLSLPPLFQPEHTLQAIPEFQQQPVIVLTGHAERTLALQAVALGAWDFMAKPLDPDLLGLVVRRAVTKQQLSREVKRLQTAQPNRQPLQQLVGSSRSMQNLRTLIERIAATDVRVLVTGPSGTGKEVISRVLHQLSLRAKQPFISVHCGAIPAELLESELFGYAKGAFTGADRDRQGLLSMADGGTLFLDEIGDMPAPMQVKLLRVLQEGTFYPVGSRTQQSINVRLVSATNAHLPTLVQQGRFREDLYYRIKGVTVETQALDERPEDIALLVQYFMQNAGDGAYQLSPAALQWFLQRQWPGNVRELKNALESVIAVAAGREIDLADIQLLYPESVPTSRQPDTVYAEHAADVAMDAAEHSPQPQRLELQVRALEIRLIRQALQQANGNRSQAARVLGLSRQGLLKKIERYGLEVPPDTE